jgi:hypothetical protein
MTRAAGRLAKRVNRQKDDDHARSDARGERDERSQQHEGNAFHPAVRSTKTTVNAGFPGGVISNDSPQCPTITSAEVES